MDRGYIRSDYIYDKVIEFSVKSIDEEKNIIYEFVEDLYKTNPELVEELDDIIGEYDENTKSVKTIRKLLDLNNNNYYNKDKTIVAYKMMELTLGTLNYYITNNHYTYLIIVDEKLTEFSEDENYGILFQKLKQRFKEILEEKDVDLEAIKINIKNKN